MFMYVDYNSRSSMKTFILKNLHCVAIITTALVMLIFWLLSFLANQEIIPIQIGKPIECIAMISSSLAISILLIAKKDIFYVLVIGFFMMFIYGHAFELMTIPIELIISTLILLFGMFFSKKRHKIKFQNGPFHTGIIFLSIACILGGFGNWEIFSNQLLVLLFICFGVVFMYLFLHSYQKVAFKDIAMILTALAIFIIVQCLIFILIKDDSIALIRAKKLHLGWAGPNNIAVILLLLMPFPYYISLISKGWRLIFGIVITYLVALTIVITYSRGGAVAVVGELIALLIFGHFKTKDKKNYYLTHGLLFVSIILIFTIYAINDFGNFSNWISSFFSDLDSVHGRLGIYQAFFERAFDNILFGYGLSEPLYFNIDSQLYTYQWGHGTLIHTFYTLGLIGLIAMGYHLYQKYYYLIKDCSLSSIVILIAFLGSGFYGLFDVSYYLIYYTLITIILLAIIPIEVNNGVENSSSQFD